MIGTTLAHFNITGKLGEGGMGEVYRAEDTKLGREVAIKVLPEMVAVDEERLARFEREAKLLASLNHPNIGAIYSLESEESKKFLVLELIEGDTLAEVLASGPLPIEKTLGIGQQIALALEAAHAKGVIHRDLKPANVKLTPDGKAKVLDFGLAKAWDVEESSGSSPLISRSPTLTQGMTEIGVLLGTAAYMSPEQARGKAVDKRADIWAFGCVMLEMLSGRKVFGGDTVTDMIAAVVATEPDWDKLPSDTPRALERLLRRCLEKDQDQRLRDIGDARLEIEEMLSKSPEELREPEAAAAPSKANRLWQLATIALAIAVAGLGYALWHSRLQPPQAVTRAYIPAPPEGDFDLGTDYPAPVAISPDGRSLVYGVQESNGEKRLWVRGLADREARPLAGTQGALYPFWSPDSRWIGFFAHNKLKKIEAAGGPAMSLCDASNGKGGSWNRDGVIIFAPSHTTTIHRVSEAGGEPVSITELGTEAGVDSHRHPRFLPDGEHFLFAARSGFGGLNSGSRVMIGSLAGEMRELMPATTNVEFADGHLLYVFERTLMARPFDPSAMELKGDAFPLAENVWGDWGALLGVFTVSQNGTLVYQTGTPREEILSILKWYDRSGEVLGEIGGPEPYGEVHLSPDGTTAAIQMVEAESSNRDLWLLDLDRGVRSRFTFEPAQDWIAVWSPDGSKIAYSSEAAGTADIWVKSVTGGGEAELVFDDEALKYPTSWSSDGRYLLFESWGSSGGCDTYALDLEEGGEPIALHDSEFVDRAPMISPNGRWVLYMSDESGDPEVYVTAFPEVGRKWQISSSNPMVARWAGNNEIFMVDTEGVIRVAEVNGEGETFGVGPVEESPITTGPFSWFSFDVTVDRDRLLVMKPTGDDSGRARMDPLTLVLNWTADLERR